MLDYTAMVLRRLVADGVLSEHGALPHVLPVVFYNGPRRWTAPVEVADMFAASGDTPAPHLPSQRYYVLDVRRAPGADLPADNLVSALVGLESARDASGLDAALRALGELVRAAGDEHLRRAFGAWLRARLGASGRLPAGAEDPLARLEETQTMLEETLGEWTREWLERGRAEGIERGLERGRAEGIERGRDEGRAEERALLCRQAARKFDGAAAEGLASALAGVTDPERLGRVGEWIIECATAEDLLARVRRDHGSDG